MIEEYHFGSITINDQVYEHDVEVYSEDKVLEWRRKESHLVDIDDVKRAVEEDPEVIIIGTGHSGMVKVSQETKDFIEEKRIELLVDNTNGAVKAFNMIREESEEKEEKSRKVVGLFHLTC
jgi:hypothetical protein